MCGICGVASHCPAQERVLRGLKTMEYRGYDSAGIVDSKMQCLRKSGKLSNLEEEAQKFPSNDRIAIGHTRWATHGRPTEENAHPHICDGTAVVHNGIIENHRELKEKLEAKGYVFSSETDSEVIAVLVQDFRKSGLRAFEAVESAVKELQGAFACCFLFKNEDIMIAASRGSPLIFGLLEEQKIDESEVDEEYYFASDAAAFTPYAQHVYFMKDNDIIEVTHSSTEEYCCTNGGESFEPVFRPNHLSESSISKGDFKHFMMKEIHEESSVIRNAIDSTESLKSELDFSFKNFSSVKILACGTSYHASLCAKYVIEEQEGIEVDVELASEFIYRISKLSSSCLCIFISESGETRDTLAALEQCQKFGCKTMAIVNVTTSALARKCDLVFPTVAGPEIGVASTKAFVAQLSVLFTLASTNNQQMEELRNSEEVVENILLTSNSQIQIMAHELLYASSLLFLGRGTLFPISLEGALKYKELCYEHAEGYAAGELKHGPIALIDSSIPVICLAPSNNLFDKVISNIQEIAARDGNLIIITDQKGKDEITESCSGSMKFICIPECDVMIEPISYVIPLELLAYHSANAKGLDVDEPRNLAKCVTVE